MLLPEVHWSLCPAEHHHSPSNIPSTVCLSSGLLGFCLDEGSSCFGARKGLCYLQHPPGWAGLELLGSGGAAGEQLLLVPLADLVQAVCQQPHPLAPDSTAWKRGSADSGLSCSLPGQSGLGKSTLINTLFKSKISRKSVQPTSEERIPKTIEIKSITHGEALQVPPAALPLGPALPCVSGDSQGLWTSINLHSHLSEWVFTIQRCLQG